MYIYICTYVYIDVYTYLSIYLCICMYKYIHTYMYVYIHVHTYNRITCIRMHTSMYIHTYIHTYIRIYVCTYTHTYARAKKFLSPPEKCFRRLPPCKRKGKIKKYIYPRENDSLLPLPLKSISVPSLHVSSLSTNVCGLIALEFVALLVPNSPTHRSQGNMQGPNVRYERYEIVKPILLYTSYY
jgi:hypothetical protein